jgi:hypothetical protein
MCHARGLSIGLTFVLVLAVSAGAQTPVGTAFTYQGRLEDAGAPANGTYDLRFLLYDADVGGSQVGSILFKEDISVANGLFTVSLDFGSDVFAGEARWLEIGVRPGASTGAFSALASRQELTPTPNAIQAPWSGVSGKPAGFADDTDNDALSTLSCASGEVAKWSGSAWACAADDNSGGDITGVTAGPGLTGGGASGDITLAVSGVTSTMITDGAVASVDILDNTITTNDIATDTILATDIAAGAVGTSEIADGSVASVDILDSTILSADIGADTILAADIAAGAVGTSEIADGSVAAVDLAPAGFQDGVDDTPIHANCTSGAMPPFGNGVWMDYIMCTINAPVAGGTVIVDANAIYYINHTNGTSDAYAIGIGNAPAPSGYSTITSSISENVPAAMPTAAYHYTRRPFGFYTGVGAGSNTYYLKAYSATGYDAADQFDWGSMIVTWYPPRI